MATSFLPIQTDHPDPTRSGQDPHREAKTQVAIDLPSPIHMSIMVEKIKQFLQLGEFLFSSSKLFESPMITSMILCRCS
jgi:hypothetical protein